MTRSRISAVSMFAILVFLIAVSSFALYAQQATAANAVVPTQVNLGCNSQPIAQSASAYNRWTGTAVATP